MIRIRLFFSLGLVVALAQGCAMRHATTPGSAASAVKAYPEDGAKPIALVHAETWSPTLFCVKLGDASLNKSQAEVIRQANMLGAETVVYPRNNVEVRMPWPLPFIIGWEEYHVWGMAVKK